MNESMIHRGPDDQGEHVEPGVGLAMCRLAIVDLAGGRQPMTNEDGSVWVVFNGEIYNHREIRDFLDARGHVLRTNSDTEVLAHLYEEKKDRLPEFLNGMFAIALWDSRERRLLLIRDRLGIKPLYYSDLGGKLLFASELQAITRSPEVSREIDLAAFSEYLTFQHTIPPRTMLRAVGKLPAGHLAIYEQGRLAIRQYWDFTFSGQPAGSDREEQLYVDRFREAFTTSVKRRLMADVPLGVFLSGGIDSSAIVAAMVQLGITEPRTYALGYPGGDVYGELNHASVVAEHFGTRHQELIVSPRDYENALPRFIRHMDDPVSDDVGLLFMLLAERAAEEVKVVLSGQGADELLGGYKLGDMQYRFDRIRRFQRLPRWLRHSLPELLAPALPASLREWLARGNADLSHINLQEARTLAWQFEEEDKRVVCPVLADVEHHCRRLVRRTYEKSGADDPMHQVLYVYVKIALAENLLVYGDKMTMAHSVELRVPFLDHELVELVAQTPARFLIRRETDGSYTTKNLLRRAMNGVLPASILERPKVAFPIPLKEWLQSALAARCRDVLLSDEARESGLYDIDELDNLLSRHRRLPTETSTLKIKNLLFFEMWRQTVLTG